MIEEIEASPGEFTSLEIARNRLAKALFFFCLGAILVIVTINQAGEDLYKSANRLQTDSMHLHGMKYRLQGFVNRDVSYFSEIIRYAFEEICLTPTEAGIPTPKPNTSTNILLGRSILHELQEVNYFESKCNPKYIGVRLDSEPWWFAVEIKRLLIEENKVPALAVESLIKLAKTAPSMEQERLRILISYWGNDGLTGLLQNQWQDWNTMKSWVAWGKVESWSAPGKESRARGYEERYQRPSEVGDWPLLGGRGNEIGRLGSEFRQLNGDELSQQVGQLVRASKDPFQALSFIAAKEDQLRQAIAAHSQDSKGVDFAVGGVAIRLPRWVDWVPWLIIGLLSIFAIFDVKVSDGQIPAPTNFWFPRLGSSRDPLSVSMPNGLDWIGRIFWFTFLALPSTICFWALASRFQMRFWTEIPHAYWRDVVGNPVDWFSPLAFGISLCFAWAFTKPRENSVGRKLAIATSFAICSGLVVLFEVAYLVWPKISVNEMLIHGRIYSVVPAVIVTLVAFLSRKTPSNFGLFMFVFFDLLTIVIALIRPNL